MVLREDAEDRFPLLPRPMESGGVLLSRAVASQVPSELRGLTSVFGMGTGGSLSLLPPEIDINLFSLLVRSLSPFSYLLRSLSPFDYLLSLLDYSLCSLSLLDYSLSLFSYLLATCFRFLTTRFARFHLLTTCFRFSTICLLRSLSSF